MCGLGEEVMDGFEKIKRDLNLFRQSALETKAELVLLEHAEYLTSEVDRLMAEYKRQNDEVERLRKIEDITRSTNHCICEFPDDLGACQEYFDMLYDILELNPRPRSTSKEGSE